MNVDTLKDIQNELGISQNEMARRIGTSTATMSNIMTGKREPRADLVKRMCEVFGKDPKELL